MCQRHVLEIMFESLKRIPFLFHSTLIPTLSKNEKASHEFSALFFTRGRFKVDIQCKSEAKFGPTPLSSTLQHVTNDTHHVYKFIPSIEITVNWKLRNYGRTVDAADCFNCLQYQVLRLRLVLWKKVTIGFSGTLTLPWTFNPDSINRKGMLYRTLRILTTVK